MARLKLGDKVETIGRWVTYHPDGSVDAIVPSRTKGEIVRIVSSTAIVATEYGDLSFQLKFIQRPQHQKGR